MTAEEKALCLERASDLVARVVEALDVGEDICDCCGRTSFDHYGERMLHDRLGPMPGKLKDLARRLKTGGFSARERVE